MLKDIMPIETIYSFQLECVRDDCNTILEKSLTTEKRFSEIGMPIEMRDFNPSGKISIPLGTYLFNARIYNVANGTSDFEKLNGSITISFKTLVIRTKELMEIYSISPENGLTKCVNELYECEKGNEESKVLIKSRTATGYREESMSDDNGKPCIDILEFIKEIKDEAWVSDSPVLKQ